MLGLAVSLALGTPGPALASVSVLPDDTATVNGTVYAITQVGDRTIIGGSFTAVGGRPRANIAALRPNGTLDTSFIANTDGTVYALATSADNSTVYAGGLFTTVNGEPKANLAAVSSTTGAVVGSWSANTTGTTPEVLALQTSGTRLYVAGRYQGIDGTTRKRLVALDAAAGNLITTFSPAPSYTVRFLDTSPDGSRVYAAGAFDSIGGQRRPAGVAELDAATGKATSFAPTGEGGSLVTAMDVSPTADRLYFGTANNFVFAVDIPTGQRLWSVKNGGDTQAIAATGTEVYIGGHFSANQTYEVKRKWIASFTLDGRVTDWNPKLGGGRMGVWALETTPTALLVGGEFTNIDGNTEHKRFARFAGTP